MASIESSRANDHQCLGDDAFGFMSAPGDSPGAQSVAVAHSGRSAGAVVKSHVLKVEFRRKTSEGVMGQQC